MALFHCLSLYEAALLSFTWTVLKRNAKGAGRTLPSGGQLLEGFVFSQVMVVTIAILSKLFERFFWQVLVTLASTALTRWVANRPGFEINDYLPFEVLGPENLKMVQVTGAQGCYMHTETQPQCLFFHKLPLEIRQKIYRYLLLHDETIEPSPLMKQKYTDIVLDPHRRRTELDTRILRSCRRIYDEAVPILYGENKFYFQTLKALHEFNGQGLDSDTSRLDSYLIKSNSKPATPRLSRLRLVRNIAIHMTGLVGPGSRNMMRGSPHEAPPDVSAEWRGLVFPTHYFEDCWDLYDVPFEPKRYSELDFPSLRCLTLNFRPLSRGTHIMDAEHGIVVEPFIRRFKKGNGLDRLEIEGLYHQPSLEAFRNGLVKKGGIFISSEQDRNSEHP